MRTIIENGMSWDASSDNQYKNELTRITGQFTINKDILVNRAPAVVLEIQDAQRDVSNAKSEIESGISLLQARNNELQEKLQSILNENEQSNSRVKTLETQVETNTKSVKEAETLAALRKEQADELRSKGEGNYHSSWMGLWRPLSEQSRLGLIIATVFFGLITLILIILYAKQVFPVIVSYFGLEAAAASNSFQLGAGRRRRN